MGNVATDVVTQINILKSRGLIINDEAKARETLLDIGYYRLGFYWHYFQSNTTSHTFQPGVKFEDVVSMYYFDFDLKYLLSKYIYRIEVHFRTQLVYKASNKYVHDNKWYVNRRYVNNFILNDFNRMYRRLSRNCVTLIQHHRTSTVHAPAWKTFEFLTFGQVYKFYDNLRDVNLKNDIASSYRLRTFQLLDNFMLSVINIRNVCMHNGVLYDYNQPTGISRIPNKKYRIKNRDVTCLNSSIRVILFMLSHISVNRANDLERDLKHLISEASKKPILNRIIINEIKFDL